MLQDVRYAFRLLVKSPGFTLVAVLTIALAIGPNTAIFSMINAVLLRPMPYQHADRIVMLWENMKSRGFDILPVSGPSFVDWKQQSHSFEDMAPAFTLPEYGFNVTTNGEPVRAQGGQAAAAFFQVLGVTPELGREFLPEEDRPGGRPVVLLNHNFWVREFGGDRAILGRVVDLDDVGYTVVGVLPPEIESLVKVDIWIPVGRNLAADSRQNHNYGIVARLKPGVSLAQAQTEMDGIARNLARRYPATNDGVGATVISINDAAGGFARPALLALLAAVGVLLLIACANIAGLLLARGAVRRKEIAVRTAVGAPRRRLVRQLLTESVLLSTMGGALGLVLAYFSVHTLRQFVPDLLPRLQRMDIDARVLAFTFAISVLTGILFGLFPAFRAANSGVNAVLKESGGRGVSERGLQRLRSILLTAQIALAVVLLTGAALLTRSFVQLIDVDPGFRPDHVLTMSLTLPKAKYEGGANQANFVKAAIARVEQLPGVHSAAVVNALPMLGRFLGLRVSSTSFEIEGHSFPKGEGPTADYRQISPEFLATMRIPLRRGRSFSEHDQEGSQPVVLINETLARRYFQGTNPIGRRLILGNSKPLEIVGVAGDVKMNGLEKQAEPAVYVPYAQDTTRSFSLVVRTERDPEALANPIRGAILGLDAREPVADVRTLERVVDDALALRRLSSWMLGVFAVLALTLASIGIYGLVSYSVTLRLREIGLRMALGASPGEILRIVVRRGIVVSLLGIAVGLPAALASARLLGGLLYGVTSQDPLTFAGVSLLLLAVALFASYFPARRALRVDPAITLRCE